VLALHVADAGGAAIRLHPKQFLEVDRFAFGFQFRGALFCRLHLIAEATAAAPGGEGGGALNSPAWLGFLDTFRTICLAPSAEILALFEELKLNS
jgi:hypothetical protein